MPVVSLNTNIASMRTQRRLVEATKSLSEISNQLSSGLRINRASDDSAGLAISAGLSLDARVTNQAIRNANDAISLSNIVEGATDQLSLVLTRITELAEQAANGTLSTVQRRSLELEAHALRREYNRIVDSTETNGLKLLNGEADEIIIQVGYNSLATSLGNIETSAVGDGTYRAPISYSTGPTDSATLYIEDVNGDGNLDYVSTSYNDGTASVGLGNGDGTFLARRVLSFGVANRTKRLSFGDLNGDGAVDIVGGEDNGASSTMYVLFGNGNGTFKAANPISVPSTDVNGTAVGDFNGDGNLDFVGSMLLTSQAVVFLGNGNGTFRAGVSYASQPNAGVIASADLNNDGIDDFVVAAAQTQPAYVVHLGSTSGTITSTHSGGTGASGARLDLADVNGDGNLDVLDFTAAGFGVAFGYGNGTFGSRVGFANFSAGGGGSAADINGDGNMDVVTVGGTTVATYLGNGNGTFLAPTTANSGFSVQMGAAGDLNNDGALDVLGGQWPGGNLGILLGNANMSPRLRAFSLRTQGDAKETLDEMKAALARLSASRGHIGATQSRFTTIISNLHQSHENFLASASRITDVDVAQASSQFVRTQIVQQTAASILAQANLSPSLALTLLRG